MLSESRKRANEKYIKNNWWQISVRYPNSFIDELRAAVDISGDSLAGYIKKALEAQMARDREAREKSGEVLD